MPRPHYPTRPPADYADADALIAAVIAAAFTPPEPVTVADYAARHRFLANAGGGYVGRWDHTIAPYLVAPMDCLTSPRHLTVALVGPGQCGKTEVAHNWLLHTVCTDPASMLWFGQTDAGIEAHVKAKIEPLLDAHPLMRERQGRRSTDDSLHFKRFAGMQIEFLGAALSNMINKSAPRIVADEWDAYDPGLGDPKTLLDVRRQTFGRESKLLAISHCDRATGMDPARDWSAGIMALYADSDRRAWWWPCPHCGAWSSPNPGTPRAMVLDFPDAAPLDEVQDAARLVCPVNGCMIEDRDRHGMNARGQWIGAGQTIDEAGEITGTLAPCDTAGFWITGTMSPFVLGGIGGLARALAKATRDARQTGDVSGLRQVVVKQLGHPYTSRRTVGTVDAATLAERAAGETHALGTVPDGVRFLTAGVDVQDNRFEALVRGWGVGGESWIIDTRRIAAQPATSAADWDALFAWLTAAEYPLADADGVLDGRVMRLRATAYDTGGAPGVTALAYAAWRRWRASGRIVMRGLFDGRAAWTVLPCKGLGSLNAPKLQTVYPDTQRRDRVARAGGNVPLGLFAANAFKDDLAGQLEIAAAAPWYVHLPAALRSPEPPHLWFEQLVAETRRPSGAWEKTTRRNESLDLMVLSHVAAHLHGLAKLRWDKPPAWAADWSRNSMVGEASAPAPTQSATVTDTAQAPPATPQKRPRPAASAGGADAAARMRALAARMR